MVICLPPTGYLPAVSARTARAIVSSLAKQIGNHRVTFRIEMAVDWEDNLAQHWGCCGSRAECRYRFHHGSR